MSSLTLAVQHIKANKRHIVIQTLVLSIVLIAMTSIKILSLILNRLHQSGTWGDANIKVFTTNETSELHRYFFNCFGFLCLLILVLSVIDVVANRKKRKQQFIDQVKQREQLLPYVFSEIICLVLELFIASLILLGFVILIQPLYENFLQLFYQHSLDQFTNLPKFVLSNGTSGFAYSLRFPLTYDISSVTLFQFFLAGLSNSFLHVVLLLSPLIFVLDFIAYYQLKKQHTSFFHFKTN